MNIWKYMAFGLIVGWVGVAAQAQSDYPNKPVKLVVGYATGGPTDVIARLVAADVAAALGQPVVIENRVGANGNIATESVAAAAPDGYTILVNTLSLNVNAILGQGRVKYDPAKDFAPLRHISDAARHALVRGQALDVLALPSYRAALGGDLRHDACVILANGADSGDSDWSRWQFTTIEGDNVPPEEIVTLIRS